MPPGRRAPKPPPEPPSCAGAPLDAPADDATLPAPPGFALVRLAAPLVPAERRREWLAEWAGELAWSWREAAGRGEPAALTRLRHHWRALGATSDALWLRRRHGDSDMWSLDLKHAARSLRRRPGFAAVVVLTLAIGIGATTAIFSVVNGVLLRPLAFPRPEQLVKLEGLPTDGDLERVSPPTSYPDYLDIRAQARSFSHVAVTRGWTVTLTAPGAEPARMPAQYVSASFLPTMGLRPLLGRDLLADDERPGAEPVALLSHELWQQRFAGDPRTVGRAITVDGVATTVVGIMPPGVTLVGEARLWLPIVPGDAEASRATHRYTAVGRLRPGVTLAAAETEVRTIARRLEVQYPESNAKRSARLVPLRDAVVGDARPALLVLLGAVALVLLIGCTNLASLFLARASAREREMAVRAALGAGRGRLVRQWMAESLLLTGAGAALGLAVAWLGMHAMLRWVPRTIPRADEVALDLPVLGFLLGVSVLTGLVFGALPAFARRGPMPLAMLREGARGATTGRGRQRLRQALVLSEVALATVLVVGAALLVKSFWSMQRSALGIQPDGLVVAQIQLPAARYDSTGAVLRFYERLHHELASAPGVRGVAFAFEHPLSEGWTSSYAIAGREPTEPGSWPESRVRPVSPGYFRTVGLPILRGRDVSSQDRFGATGAVVVNEAFVRRHFPGVNPIGQVVNRGQAWWPGQPVRFEIVGVVADEPFMGVRRPAEPATYYAYGQFPMSDMWVVLRTDCARAADGCDAAAVAGVLRERIWRLDPDLPVESVRSMRELLGASVAEPRFNAALLSIFALVALLLAAVGIYGVLSYTVTQRTGEIGVRIALGAARGRVVRQVVGQGLGVALVGVALGVVGALGAGRLLSSLLVGVSGRDPLVLGGVAALLSLVALAAAWLPARRASRVEPVVALRAE